MSEPFSPTVCLHKSSFPKPRELQFVFKVGRQSSQKDSNLMFVFIFLLYSCIYHAFLIICIYIRRFNSLRRFNSIRRVRRAANDRCSRLSGAKPRRTWQRFPYRVPGDRTCPAFSHVFRILNFILSFISNIYIYISIYLYISLSLYIYIYIYI